AEAKVTNLPNYAGSIEEALAWVGSDLALAHDGAGADRALARARARATDFWYADQQQIAAEVALGRWSMALETGVALKAVLAQPYHPRTGYFPGVQAQYSRRGAAANLALATAMSGDLAGGEAMAA